MSEQGKMVRVVEVWADDASPEHKIGDVAHAACIRDACQSNLPEGFVLLGCNPGTYCRVEPVRAEPVAEPASYEIRIPAPVAPAATSRGLLEIYSDLGPNARRVLLAFAERLDVGREHGDFTKRLDFPKEKRNELLDFLAYEIAESLGLCQ